MRRTILGTLLFLLSLPAIAQVKAKSYRSTASNVDYYAWNNGILGRADSLSVAGATYPRGYGKSYIYGSGLWFGARKTLSDSIARLAFICYNAGSGLSWATPGEPSPTDSGYSDVVFWSSQVDHSNGSPLSPGGSVWPLWRSEHSSPSLFDQGVYVANPSERHPGGELSAPAFIPGAAEQAVTRFHDGDLTRYEVNKSRLPGYPLGLAFQQNIVGWHGGSLGSSILVQYTVTNIGKDTLRDCYIGQITDMDLGSGGNDHFAWLSTDTTLGAGLAWSDQTLADGQRGVLAISTLETPTVGEGGIVDDGNRRQTEHQLPLTSVRSITIREDAHLPYEFYDALALRRFDSDRSSADQRGLISTGSFTFLPGSSLHFAIAYSMFGVDWPLSSEDSTKLLTTLHTLRDVYYEASSSTVPREISGMVAAVDIAPNPVTTVTTVSGMLAGSSSVDVSVIDMLGREVLHPGPIQVVAGRYSTPIDCSMLSAGTYIVTVRSGENVSSMRVMKQ